MTEQKPKELGQKLWESISVGFGVLFAFFILTPTVIDVQDHPELHRVILGCFWLSLLGIFFIAPLVGLIFSPRGSATRKSAFRFIIRVLIVIVALLFAIFACGYFSLANRPPLKNSLLESPEIYRSIRWSVTFYEHP